jgi:hypothetical protein
MPTPSNDLSQAKALFDSLDTGSRLLSSPSSSENSSQTLTLMASLVANADGLKGDTKFAKEKDDVVAAMVKRGREIDPTFPSAEKAANWEPNRAVPAEYGADEPLSDLKEKARLTDKISDRVDASARQILSRADTTTSKIILQDAVEASDTSAFSVRSALRHDTEQRYKRRELRFRWRQSDYDPGVGQEQKKVDRREKYHTQARDKSISLAVESANSPGGDVEKATLALARAIASDKTFRSAFKDHDAFQDLVTSVAMLNPDLKQLVKQVEADPEGDHAIADPRVIRNARAGRDTSLETRTSDVKEEPGVRRDMPGLKEHQHYTGKYDEQRNTLFSRHALKTTLRHYALLQVPGGEPVEALSKARLSPRRLDMIREQVHRARLEAVDQAATSTRTAGDDSVGEGMQQTVSRLNDRLVLKITDDTGWRSRPQAEKRSRTREYKEGAGEVPRDNESRTIYITPEEVMSDRAPDIILRRTRAALGVDAPDMVAPTIPSNEAGKDEPIVTETPRDPSRIEVGDEIELTAYSDDLEMNKGRRLKVTAVDHETGSTDVVNDEDEPGTFNHKTFTAWQLVPPEREVERGDEPATPSTATSDFQSMQDEKPPIDEREVPTPANGALPSVGDKIQLTAYSDDLEMNKGRTLDVTAVDHVTGSTGVVNDEDETGTVNLKTFTAWQSVPPEREVEREDEPVTSGMETPDAHTAQDETLPVDERVVPTPDDVARLSVGDKIELTAYSEELEMNAGRTLEVTAVDDKAGLVEVVNEDDEKGSFDPKTFQNWKPAAAAERDDVSGSDDQRKVANGAPERKPLRRLSSASSLRDKTPDTREPVSNHRETMHSM